MSEHHPDVDPANGTEPYTELPAESQQEAGTPADEQQPADYTAPEKITSVARMVLARPAADAKVRALLGLITSPFGTRLLVQPMLALLPPLDDAAAWDEWLGMLAGFALELASDGVEIDVDAARVHAGYVLAALFEESPG
jgi:hypothetical protein